MKLLALLDGPWGRRLFVAGLLVAIAVTLFFRVRYVPSYNLNTGGYDQNVVYGVVRIMNGTPLYTDPEKAPFSIIQYGPVHMRLVATVCDLLGTDPADVQQVYVITRSVVLLLNLLACWVLFRVGRRLGLRASNAFGVAAFFFTGMAVFYYMRPDSTYILFFWLHVLAFIPVVQAERGKSTWSSMLPSVIFGVLAVFTKQTGVIAFLLAGGFFMIQRRWRDLMLYAALSMITGIAALGLLIMEGGLSNAYKNVVLGVMNDVSPEWLMAMVVSKYFLIGLPITVLGIAAGWKWLRGPASAIERYVALGAVVCLGWAVITGLKAGMNLNYFTEHYIFAAIAMAMVVDGSSRTTWHRWVARSFIVLIPMIALVRTAMLFSAFEITRYYADRPGTYRAEQELVDQLRSHGLQPDEYLLLWHRGYTELFLPEQTLMDQKDIQYKSQLHGRLDQSDFFEMAGDGRLKYVVAPTRVKDVVILGRSFNDYIPYFATDSFRVAIHPRSADELR
ncbi:MAG: hypothetical protein IT226_14890 [Flavobacteriales bacterium]|nr:hypothetical protein [Flavobacteriales bacterium]